MTVIESGAGLDNLRKLKEGTFDFALSIDIPSGMQMYNGIDVFKGKPWKDVRVLFIRNVTADRFYVRKDSGIKTFRELGGKRFSPGIPGSSSATYMVKFEDPYIPFIETKKGAITEIPDAGPMFELAPIVGAMASKSLPEDIAYRIIKAYTEGIAEVGASYPSVNGWNPVADFFKYVPEGAELPAHAGMVKYARELGIDVPRRFIPEECKGK